MTARKPGAKRGRPVLILPEEEAEKLREFRRQQIPIAELKSKMGYSDRVLQREMVRLGLAGHVCPHCGKGTPTRWMGLRRDQSLSDPR